VYASRLYEYLDRDVDGWHRHVEYSIRLSIIADGNMGFTAYVVLDFYTKSKPYSSALSHEATGTTVDKTDGK